MYDLNADFEGDTIKGRFITGRTFYHNKRKPGIGKRARHHYRAPRTLQLTAAISLSDYLYSTRFM